MSDSGAWGGRPMISKENWRRGSEYGGVGGLIAPRDSPHNPADVASEQLMMIYNTDPAIDDQGTDVVIPETSPIRGYGE